MPRYELCYILAAGVSDDQVPEVATQIQKFITDFGGTDIQEELLGKKKLAYPIKKTRNGFYVVETFTMPTNKINDLEAKVRSQTATVIRHLIINIDEHLVRSEKDKVAQSKLTKQATEGEQDQPTQTPRPAPAAAPVARPEPAPAPAPAPAPKAEPVKDEVKEIAKELSTEELDKQIEAALSDDLIK